MLPETKIGKALYAETRDYRNRWRQSFLTRSKGDIDAFTAYALEDLAENSDFPQFKEAMDFALSEGMMTEEMVNAAEQAASWGSRLRELIGEMAS